MLLLLSLLSVLGAYSRKRAYSCYRGNQQLLGAGLPRFATAAAARPTQPQEKRISAGVAVFVAAACWPSYVAPSTRAVAIQGLPAAHRSLLLLPAVILQCKQRYVAAAAAGAAAPCAPAAGASSAHFVFFAFPVPAAALPPYFSLAACDYGAAAAVPACTVALFPFSAAAVEVAVPGSPAALAAPWYDSFVLWWKSPPACILAAAHACAPPLLGASAAVALADAAALPLAAPSAVRSAAPAQSVEAETAFAVSC